MDVDVRFGVSSEDVVAALQPVVHYFGGPTHPQDAQRFTRVVGDPSRMVAVREGGAVVGGAGSFLFELTVPGGTVTAAGISVVGVLPTHRRRGILRAMMRAQIDDVHRRGEPVAYLWASEDTIYGQFGYGMASVSGQIEIAKADVGFALPFAPRSQSRLVDDDEAYPAFDDIYDRVRRATPAR